ncbi:Glycosyl transferase family 2 [uncultured archaeon]|nr:Glycosyl transferase family 2 [uncultured archaeon]
MQKLLTICIPTYNRAKFLRRLLEQIEQESSGLHAQMEVAVSDNASDDDSQKVLAEFASRLPLRTGRNPANLRYDANVLAAVMLAKGRFAWLMGDDDLFIPGRLREVFELLKTAPEDLGGFFTNYYRGPSQLGLDLRAEGLRLYSKTEHDADFFKATYGANFIGCVILDSALCQDLISKHTRLDGIRVMKTNLQTEEVVFKDFVQAYLTLECVMRSARFGIYSKPCVAFGGDGSYATQEQALRSAQKTAMYMRHFRTFYPSLFNYRACPFSSANLGGLARYLVLFDPAMPAEHQALFYQAAAELMAEYKANGDWWWLAYRLAIGLHRHVFFLPPLMHFAYVTAVHARGRKTYMEREREKQAAGLRESQL